MDATPRQPLHSQLQTIVLSRRSTHRHEERSPSRNGRQQWIRDGCLELIGGIANWRITHLIGIGDLRRRYARSRLGQFWLVVSTGIMILTLGVVWSALWRMPTADLMPSMAIALVLWALIAGALGEAPTALISAGPIFLNQAMSFSTVIFALLYRQLLVFLHNFVIVVLVFIVFGKAVDAHVLLVLPGFTLLMVNLAWSSYLVAIVCTRFRDLAPLVQSILMLAFLVTPVIWQEGQLPPGHHWLSLFNPFAVLISLVRDPILGKSPDAAVWLIALLLAVAGSLLTVAMIGKYRRRIIYWI